MNLRTWSCQLVVLDPVTAAAWIEWASEVDADYFAGLDDWRNPWDDTDAGLLDAPPNRQPLPVEWVSATQPRLLAAVAEWDWPDTGGYCTASVIVVSESELRAVLGDAPVDHAWQAHQVDEQVAAREWQQAMDEQAASVERRFRVQLVGTDQWAAYDARGVLLGYAPATPDDQGRYHPARDEIGDVFAASPGETDYQPVPDHVGVWRAVLPW